MLIEDNLVFILNKKKIKPYYSSYSIKESVKGYKINDVCYKMLLPDLMLYHLKLYLSYRFRQYINFHFLWSYLGFTHLYFRLIYHFN
jgi:hypothetical protein